MRQFTGSKLPTDWRRLERQGSLPTVGEALLASLGSYRPHQAGQPSASADCYSDHSLVGSKIRLKPRKIHHAKSKGHPRIDTCATAEQAKAQSFAEILQKKLADQPTTEDTDAKWSHLRDAIYDSAMSAFGRKERKNADWFEAHWNEM